MQRRPQKIKSRTWLLALVPASLALMAAIPAISQESPESLLPPGFGDEVDEPDAAAPARRPSEGIRLDPNLADELIAEDENVTSSTGPARRSSPSAASSTSEGTLEGASGEEKEGDESEGGVRVGLRELPSQAQRSLAAIGVLGPDSGDMGLSGFAGFKGSFLSNVMRRTDAPIASRWSSILLRRALLTHSTTPRDVHGADWAAERAWLLLRMGEADSARMLVQAVDTDKFTPKMMQVAMQAALSTSDPTGLCPIAEKGVEIFEEPSWPLARAMCHGLSGESAQANALIDRTRDRTKVRGIDVLLAEKVVGAGANTRRAVMIQWDDVKQLTAWRYGLASATGLDIPERLMASVGPQVAAWRARSPLTTYDVRIPFAEQAAAMGVFSAPALIDLYSAWYDSTDPSEHAGKGFVALRNGYAAPNSSTRLAALKTLWDDPKLNAQTKYARLILTSKAASLIEPKAEFAADSERLVASMLSAGLDKSAARWAAVATSGSDTIGTWALLAAGGTKGVVEVTSGQIGQYRSSVGEGGERKAQFLFAALAGLGRLDAEQINDLAEDYSVPVGKQTRWTRALGQATRFNSPAAVALIAAAGLQTRDWKTVPPAHLYHIVLALRTVGLEGEARMIAAEALTRG